MYRELTTMMIKVFFNGIGIRYALLFEPTIGVHMMLYLNESTAIIYLILVWIFVASSYYADRRTFLQIVEGFILCGAHRKIYIYTSIIQGLLHAFFSAIVPTFIYLLRGYDSYAIMVFVIAVAIAFLLRYSCWRWRL